MTTFLVKFAKLIIIPLAIFLVLIILWDPFRILYDYKEYYKNNNINLNREYVCYQLLEKQTNKTNFIIGSSRSRAYDTRIWAKYLNENPNTFFHYDGNAFDLFRATNAFTFLTKHHSIHRILLIIDYEFLHGSSTKNTHLFQQPPQVSGGSYIKFYGEFLRAAISPYFITTQIVEKIIDVKHRLFPQKNKKHRFYFTSNNSTGDILPPAHEEIQYDSLGYYQKIIKSLPKRNGKIKIDDAVIDKQQLRMLNEISAIIKQNNIDIKLVISPLFNQKSLHPNDVLILNSIFGKSNVFDFSGVNELTNPISNYYESSHYKPNVGNEIMHRIYASDTNLSASN
jgi:hypothetical protein